MNLVDDILTHPVLTTATGAAVTTVGALNKFAEDLPIVHDVLSDACMCVGLLTCLVGFAVQIRKWRIAGLEEVKLQQEIDKGA